jgi:hypothetical protein
MAATNVRMPEQFLTKGAISGSPELSPPTGAEPDGRRFLTEFYCRLDKHAARGRRDHTIQLK